MVSRSGSGVRKAVQTRLLYLNTLQQRSKWKFKQPTVSAKEFVLTLNETQPGNNKSVLGQIASVSKGRDGLACVVEVSTKEELL
ncbi:hypothetical protein DMENIID0001_005440 [Sergentomyia squamirostris]